MPGDDKVGYGRPPRSSQFRKGQSGNPKGRPKNAKNFKTLLVEALEEKVAVTENGARKTITKRQAVTKQLVNKAASGDANATKTLLGLIAGLEHSSEATRGTDVTLTQEDQAVINGFLARVRQFQNGES